jgi:hypothetical protein
MSKNKKVRAKKTSSNQGGGVNANENCGILIKKLFSLREQYRTLDDEEKKKNEAEQKYIIRKVCNSRGGFRDLIDELEALFSNDTFPPYPLSVFHSLCYMIKAEIGDRVSEDETANKKFKEYFDDDFCKNWNKLWANKAQAETLSGTSCPEEEGQMGANPGKATGEKMEASDMSLKKVLDVRIRQSANAYDEQQKKVREDLEKAKALVVGAQEVETEVLAALKASKKKVSEELEEAKKNVKSADARLINSLSSEEPSASEDSSETGANTAPADPVMDTKSIRTDAWKNPVVVVLALASLALLAFFLGRNFQGGAGHSGEEAQTKVEQTETPVVVEASETMLEEGYPDPPNEPVPPKPTIARNELSDLDLQVAAQESNAVAVIAIVGMVREKWQGGPPPRVKTSEVQLIREQAMRWVSENPLSKPATEEDVQARSLALVRLNGVRTIKNGLLIPNEGQEDALRRELAKFEE